MNIIDNKVIQLPKFDRSDYGLDKNGKFYISKKLIDYVSGYQVDLYCSSNNWALPLPMTLNLAGDYYEYYSGQSYNSIQDYYFLINPTTNPKALNTFYVPTAVINYLVYGDKDTKLNQSKNGYNFYTYPIDLINNAPSLNHISFTYELNQNFPNPFNPISTINYSIPKASFVKIKVYDVLGREVSTLVNENKQAGNYSIRFNGSKLVSGIYFYRMEAGLYTQTKKLVLLK